jgi:hypothetical protein
MICPNCKSKDTMTTRTHVKESTTVIGWFWRSESQKEEKTVKCECLDCGHEWDGEV